MKILVVMPHYFGPSHPDNNLPSISSYIEPLGRIAAMNEAIVSLHQLFGPNRHTLAGAPIPADAEAQPRQVDVVVMAMRGSNLLAELGLDPGAFEVEYVDEKAPWIAFNAHRLLRDRLGSYDFYCYMEDDLVIRDPAFFDKLIWFQQTFGPRTLLAPVRYEVSSTGTPARVIADPNLPESVVLPFRRPNQRQEIEGVWNGQRQAFALANNPHAASFFLTQEQLASWVKLPSFDDRDASWVGPLESAATLSVGKVFDIYKPTRPDPFFLDIQHAGIRYAPGTAPPGQRYGEPPLLAIAQNALRAAVAGDATGIEESFANLVARWLAQGTAVEQQAAVDKLRTELHQRDTSLDRLQADNSRLQAEVERLQAESKEHRSVVKGLRARITQSDNALAQRVTQIDRLQADNSHWQAEIERLQSEIEGHRRGMEELRIHVAQSNNELQHRCTQIDRLQAANNHLQAEVDGLQTEITEHRSVSENLRTHIVQSNEVQQRTVQSQIEKQQSLRWLLGSARAEVIRRLIKDSRRRKSS